MLTKEQIQQIQIVLTDESTDAHRRIHHHYASQGVDLHHLRLLCLHATQFLELLDRIANLKETESVPSLVFLEADGSFTSDSAYSSHEQRCPDCGSDLLRLDASSGETDCMNCGKTLENPKDA